MNYYDQMDEDTRAEIDRLPVRLRERAAAAIADGYDLDTSTGYDAEVEAAWLAVP